MELSNENIIYQKKGDVEYLQFKKLLEYKDKITHGYGIGLNKNYRTAKANKEALGTKEYEKAIKDYKDLSKALGIEYETIIKTNQMHTDKVQIVDGKQNLNEPDFDIYKKTDSLITDKANLSLSTTNADCILLLFYDPVKNAIGNAHSGWRGTLQRISVKTVQKMKDEYGSNPKDIIACMCPSIRKCHFEVEQDVYEEFYNEFKSLKQLDEIFEKRGNKWHIDTNLINKIILQDFGLKPENIIDSNICSVCYKDKIHSFRAEGKDYGLNTAIISLQK